MFFFKKWPVGHNTQQVENRWCWPET